MPYGPHAVDVLRDVATPMRDGTRQWADLYIPRGESRPVPAILERTPYSKDNSSEVQVDAPAFYASHGYAVVISDVRGRFRGEGEFYPFRDDPVDGYDTVEWIAAQPWCNGRVGTMGGSYSGVTQYRLAIARPPHLACMYCRESSSDYQWEWVFRGGAFELAFMWWWTAKWLLSSGDARGELSPDLRDRLKIALDHRDEEYARLPVGPLALVEGHYDWYNEWLRRCDDAELWGELGIARFYGEVEAPVMHLGAWFDIFQRGTFENFLGMRRHARTPRARNGQRMLIGPWQHGPKLLGQRVQGELDFGAHSAFDFNELRLPWYDYWCKGLDNEVARQAPVRLFVMGVNEWRDYPDWPPPEIRYVDYFLREERKPHEEGGLSLDPPGPRESPDTYRYDPMDPTPTIGGNTLYIDGGPRDQRKTERYGLPYTSAPLEQDLTVIGPVRCILHASSSCRDTDWVVRLTEVDEQGRSMLVCDGILRARYRESRYQPSLLEPGRVYRFEVDLWNTAQVFRAGHRIRVAIASSCFPRFDRNLNTGDMLYFSEAREVALNTVYHDARHASRIVLPVLP